MGASDDIRMSSYQLLSRARDVIREWKEDGWSQVTILGKRGPIERTGVLRSEKLPMIEASWIEEGKEN